MWWRREGASGGAGSQCHGRVRWGNRCSGRPVLAHMMLEVVRSPRLGEGEVGVGGSGKEAPGSEGNNTRRTRVGGV